MIYVNNNDMAIKTNSATANNNKIQNMVLQNEKQNINYDINNESNEENR